MTAFPGSSTWRSGIVALATLGIPVLDQPRIDPSPPTVVCEGTIQNVGPAIVIIRAVPSDEFRTFNVAENTRITLNGRRANLYELFMGDYATVTAHTKESEIVASVIEARSPL